MLNRLQLVLVILSIQAALVTLAWGQEEPPLPLQPESRKATPLDLIPDDAGAAIAVKNLKELRELGQTFAKRTEMDRVLNVPGGIDWLLGFLGVNAGLDLEAPVAFVLVDPVTVGVEGFNFGKLEKLLVLMIPIKDINDMAENFGIKAAEIQNGKIKRSEKQVLDRTVFLTVRGQHLLMAGEKQTLKVVVKSKVLRQALSKDLQEPMDQSDIVLYANPKRMGEQWENTVGAWKATTDQDQAGAELVEELLKEVRFGLFGIRLDDGLGFNAVTQFKDTPKVKELLAKLSGQGAGSDLRGLPLGKVLTVHAMRNSGQEIFARGRLITTFLNPQPLASVAERPQLLGLFGETWGRLQGSRVALYENENEREQGLLSALAILDTKDPRQYLADLQELAVFIKHAGQPLADEGADAINMDRIKRLIQELGSDSFEVRQTAAVKLGFVGEPALPLLKDAMASDDAEVAAQARRLSRQISAIAAERREGLLEQNLLRQLEPNFAYLPNAEQRDGYAVDVVAVQLPEADEPHRQQLRQLLGPDWAKIRVAVHGTQVFVLIGSDTALLDQALMLAKTRQAGLGQVKDLAVFRKRCDSAHRAELHLSVAAYQNLIDPQPNLGRVESPPELSSVSLTVDPLAIRVDAYLPFSEVKAAFHYQGTALAP